MRRFTYSAQTDIWQVIGVVAVNTRLMIKEIVVSKDPPYNSVRNPAGNVDMLEPRKKAPCTQLTSSFVQ